MATKRHVNRRPVGGRAWPGWAAPPLAAGGRQPPAGPSPLARNAPVHGRGPIGRPVGPRLPAGRGTDGAWDLRRVIGPVGHVLRTGRLTCWGSPGTACLRVRRPRRVPHPAPPRCEPARVAIGLGLALLATAGLLERGSAKTPSTSRWRPWARPAASSAPPKACRCEPAWRAGVPRWCCGPAFRLPPDHHGDPGEGGRRELQVRSAWPPAPRRQVVLVDPGRTGPARSQNWSRPPHPTVRPPLRAGKRVRGPPFDPDDDARAEIPRTAPPSGRRDRRGNPALR